MIFKNLKFPGYQSNSNHEGRFESLKKIKDRVFIPEVGCDALDNLDEWPEEQRTDTDYAIAFPELKIKPFYSHQW